MIGVANVVERGAVTPSLLHNTVLVLLAGSLVGYVASLARNAEQQLAMALHVQAAARERDRLARAVHDGVLQALALISKQAREMGTEATQLAELAQQQEIALRRLVTSSAAANSADRGGAALPADSDGRDLREVLAVMASPFVTIATPPAPVLTSESTAAELEAAILASLDNVQKHAGPDARAFVLLGEDREEVIITIRDTGRGCPPDRFEQAAAEGRIGVAQSIIGRLAALGGSAGIEGRPGDGVEVVLRVPRHDGSTLLRR